MANPIGDQGIGFTAANYTDRLQLVEASFKTVLDADLHEDDKAGRILSTMAFLTAAAAAVLSAAEMVQKPPSIY